MKNNINFMQKDVKFQQKQTKIKRIDGQLATYGINCQNMDNKFIDPEITSPSENREKKSFLEDINYNQVNDQVNEYRIQEPSFAMEFQTKQNYKEDQINEIKLNQQQKEYLQMKEKKKKNICIYDFVKVKVQLDNDHFYIFSRFIIIRILTLIKVHPKDAVKIAREIKKNLVNENCLQVSQQDLEIRLFKIIMFYNYSHSFIESFKMISLFYRKRIPFVLFVSGAPYVQKSLISTLIAERINISNVLQTKIVDLMMKSLDNFDNVKKTEDCDNDEEVLQNFEIRSKMIQKGVQMDLQKCILEGKSIIIEGNDLNLNLYLKRDHEKLFLNFRDQKMNEIDQRGIVAVPIILEMNSSQHQYEVKNIINQQNQNLDNNQRDSKITELLQKYQSIQKHIIQCNKDLAQIVEVHLNSIETTIQKIHDLVLLQIEQAYKRNDF